MIVFGSTLFWALIGAAVLSALVFIGYVVRRCGTDRLLEEAPLPRDQALHTTLQIDTLKEILADTGYAYDWQQNIFYSVLNPWQRKFGYCRVYDESSAALGMVLDSEPVYFDYGGKKWMIELWKGQYGITVGAEIGIYNTTGPDLNIPGVFNGTFFGCAADDETLSMTFTLIRNSKVLFSRAARHWWLTGFMPGVFSKPEALTMEASITFKDREMLSAFLGGLLKIGYTQEEYRLSGKSVLVLFEKPHSRQPHSRRGLFAWLTQHRNRRLVCRYRELTTDMTNIVDILDALKSRAPALYKRVLGAGRPKELYKLHEVIRPYLGQE